jgi:ribonucleoside-diphosphate reductase alpha subunit
MLCVKSLEKHYIPEIYDFVLKHEDIIQKAIEDNLLLDLDNDFFTVSNYINMYSAKPHPLSPNVEIPHYTYMRVAVQIHYLDGIDRVIEKYILFAKKYLTQATTTIFNACFRRQLSSCFLATTGDNIDSIVYDTCGDLSKLLSQDGGVGIDFSNIRYSTIANNKRSDGVPALAIKISSDVEYIKREKSRRGAAAIYLPTHHGQMEDFLMLHDESGDSKKRAHGIFTAMATTWNFWDRLYNEQPWYGFCPKLTSQLNHLTGVEFTKEYNKVVNFVESQRKDELKKLSFEDQELIELTKKYDRAEQLLDVAINILRQNGTPFFMFQDACHFKSNQKYLGKIKMSNLCTEIVEYTATEEHDNDYQIASCNLGSINLAKFAIQSKNRNNKFIDCIDFELLDLITQASVENCDNIITVNFYPLEDDPRKPVSRPNKDNRPIAVGVNGFADLFYLLDIYLDSEEGEYVNKVVTARMYWSALVQSLKLALKHGPYPTFKKSPTAEGKLQFDLWAEEFKIRGPNQYRKEEDDVPVSPSEWGQKPIVISYLDRITKEEKSFTIEPTWRSLSDFIVIHGIRNSLLLAYMPTASSSNVMGSRETTEFDSIKSVRQLLHGDFYQTNKYFLHDMNKLGLWNEVTNFYIMYFDNSIQGFTEFVKYCLENKVMYDGKQVYTEFVLSELKHIERKYRSMWEYDPKVILKRAAERGRYICHSQSLNLYLRDKKDVQIKAYYMMAEMLGLKTVYYGRTQFTGIRNKITIPASFKFLFKSYESKTLIPHYNLQIKEVMSERAIRSDNDPIVCIKCST